MIPDRASCSRVTAIALITALIAAFALLTAPEASASAPSGTATFDPGAEQTFTVPAGVSTIHVVAVGGNGANNEELDSSGGTGAVVTTDVAVTPGATLSINVGSNGGSAGTGGVSGTTSSGGAGGCFWSDCAQDANGGGGGGASSVQTCSSSSATCTDSYFGESDPRLVVAAGGGGAGGYDGCAGGNGDGGISNFLGGNCSGGGGGGGGIGGNGSPVCDQTSTAGRGATPTAAGAGGSGISGQENGTSGSGAVGGNGFTTAPAYGGGGGGGGGFYGGGGGGATWDCDAFGAGGGAGSSFSTGSMTVSADASAAPSVTISYGDSAETTVSAVSGTGTYADTATLTATLSSGGAALPGKTVDFTVDAASVGSATTDSAGIATLSGVDITGNGAGTDVGGVGASFAGDAGYLSSDASGDLDVAKATQAVTFTSTAPASPVVGDSYTPSATGGASGNDVTFSVDAATTTNACSIDGTGTVSFDHTGSCVIDADQAGTTNYTDAPTTDQTVTVGPAASTVALVVHHLSLSATVSPVAPATEVPTGSVQFLVGGSPVGTATLSNGAATLQFQVPAGAWRHVAVVYPGDADFTASTASTTRKDPKLHAWVTSRRPMSRSGWYTTPVTVHFSCTAGSAALTSSCPAPVRLAASGAGRTVTRVITTFDGGAAARTVGPINIDRTRPSVSVSGVRDGDLYHGRARHVGCVATDAVSGIKRCAVDTTTDRHGITHYRATGTNRAGLSRSVHGSYRLLGIWIGHAAFSHGRFHLTAGRSYWIYAASSSRPSYLWAAPTATAHPADVPHGGHVPFVAGRDGRWQLRVTITRHMIQRYSRWNLGIAIGGKVRILPVQLHRPVDR
ncbi:MAG: large repetitive protein [Frankiaceae bacterium]|nr:large repetitive protein [Frankiaceae bacterium]